MGMFDKDRVFGGKRLDAEIEDGIPFVLFDAAIVAENVQIGDEDMPPATKTALVVAHLKGGNPAGPIEGDAIVVGTFASAIAGKVRDKSPGDLPAVVETMTVDSSTKGRNPAKVLQFVAPWRGDIPKNLPTVESVEAGEAL